ncbi:hypothetical protein [Azospirillum sp. sgz302134]
MARVKVLLADTGPLFTLALGDALDLLGRLSVPVVLTDEVVYEATWNTQSEAARLVRRWLDGKPDYLEVVETEVGHMAASLRRAGMNAPSDLGEESVLNAIKLGRVGEGPYMIVFEEARLADPQFYGPRPVHAVSTRAFLVGLERSGILTPGEADAVWQKVRGARRNPNPAIIDIPSEVDGEETRWIPAPDTP